MANNKVLLANGTVLIDLTDTTATASDVVSGSFFYDKSGVKRTGTLVVDETYSITKTLTNATSTNDDTKVIAGNSFFADLTPARGYTLHEITVTMGGVDITDQVFKPGTGAKAITANGTYVASNDSVSGYDRVVVNVPSGAADLGTKNITANGTYAASSDSLDGYSEVTVNVPTGTTPTGTKQISITENGTITEDVTTYANAEITVNVQGGSGGNPQYGLITEINITSSVSEVRYDLPDMVLADHVFWVEFEGITLSADDWLYSTAINKGGNIKGTGNYAPKSQSINNLHQTILFTEGKTVLTETFPGIVSGYMDTTGAGRLNTRSVSNVVNQFGASPYAAATQITGGTIKIYGRII